MGGRSGAGPSVTVEIRARSKGLGTCRGCGASIEWGEIVKSGARMPFDPPIVALRTRHDNAGELIEEVDLTTNHWATCPQAKAFKR